MPGAPAPAGLGEAGLALWSEVSGAFELRADEAVLLEQMARTLDDIGQMREAIARDGLVVTGSQGQSRPNGMLAELRGSRLLLLRLAQQLALPDGDDDKAGATPASRKAARAANERWRREAVASGEA